MVGAYFPNVPSIESEALRGAHVAIVVPASYTAAPPGQGGSGGAETECPAPAG